MSAPRPAQHPAPWSLQGRGVLLAYQLTRSWKAEQGLGAYQGPLAVVCLVDYARSPVGPYQEILFMPGRLPNSRGKHLSIHRIYVDSQASVMAGRRNWGIPKQLAAFQWEDDGRGVQVQVKHRGQDCFQVHVRRIGPSFPVFRPMLPVPIYQRRQGRSYWTRPSARGRASFAKLEHSWAALHGDGGGFPDLRGQRPLAAAIVERFRMEFPPAEIA